MEAARKVDRTCPARGGRHHERGEQGGHRGRGSGASQGVSGAGPWASRSPRTLRSACSAGWRCAPPDQALNLSTCAGKGPRSQWRQRRRCLERDVTPRRRAGHLRRAVRPGRGVPPATGPAAVWLVVDVQRHRGTPFALEQGRALRREARGGLPLRPVSR
jgi:hypothetical protein